MNDLQKHRRAVLSEAEADEGQVPTAPTEPACHYVARVIRQRVILRAMIAPHEATDWAELLEVGGKQCEMLAPVARFDCQACGRAWTLPADKILAHPGAHFCPWCGTAWTVTP